MLLRYRFIFAVSFFLVLILGNQIHVHSTANHTHHGAHESVQNQKKDNIEFDDVSGNESSKSYAEQIIEYCDDGNEHCAIISLDVLDKTEGRQDVLNTFSDLNFLYDKRDFSCHHVGHNLGLWLYNYTKDLKEALNQSTLFCGGSNYHGIFQSYFEHSHQNHNLDKHSIKVSDLCPIEEENVSWMHERDCIHGIGHGLTIHYNYDTQAAVRHCNEFMPQWAESACSRGIFMENVDHFIKTGEGDFDKNEIYSPCNNTVEKFTPQCYYYLPMYLLEGKNYSHNDTYAQCDDISPHKFVKYCYEGFGRTLFYDGHRNPEKAIASCNQGKESDYYDDCLIGTLKSMLKQDGKISSAFRFCSHSDVDFRSECHEIVGMWIKAFLYPNPQDLQKECSKTPETAYVTDCINASENTDVQASIFEPM